MDIVLLKNLLKSVRGNFSGYMQAVLKASADHGTFGMNLLEAMYREFPATACENCGVCCNAVSIYSLEYHYLLREVMSRQTPEQIRLTFQRIFAWPERMVEGGEERRIRCPFRDDAIKVCLVHPARPFACRLFGMKKADGTRDCDRVRELVGSPGTGGATAGDVDYESFQHKVMENSESWEVYPDRPPISFFPFDFWVLRYAIGPQKALRIYRDILVPASTPLTAFWQNFPKK